MIRTFNTFINLERGDLSLKNPVQHYDWGKPSPDSLVADLAGIPGCGKPCAELWMGTHPKSQSLITYDGEQLPLADFIAKDPRAILGAETARRFECELPFLMKILSVGSALSIQAHPTKERARILFEQDPVNYLDTNHKPEIAVALTKMTLLNGFRSLAEMQGTLEEHPEIGALVEPSKRKSKEEIYTALILADVSRSSNAARLLNDKLLKKESLTEQDKLFLNCYELYGASDPGLFSIYMLQHMTLQPGESIYTGPNIPHAYLSGNLVECMANSDNVVRAGLTPKFVDKHNLVSMLEFEAPQSRPLQPINAAEDGSRVVFAPVGVEEFFIEKLAPSPSPHHIELTSARIAICTSGSVNLESPHGPLAMNKGDVIFLPAFLKEITAHVVTGELFFAGVPE